MPDKEQISEDAKLAVLQVEQKYIKESVQRVENSISNLSKKQTDQYDVINAKLDCIENYINRQKGIISVVVGVTVAFSSTLLLTVQHLWGKLFP